MWSQGVKSDLCLNPAPQFPAEHLFHPRTCTAPAPRDSVGPAREIWRQKQNHQPWRTSGSKPNGQTELADRRCVLIGRLRYSTLGAPSCWSRSQYSILLGCGTLGFAEGLDKLMIIYIFLFPVWCRQIPGDLTSLWKWWRKSLHSKTPTLYHTETVIIY